MEQYKRYAFISYNHRDVRWAKWLHRKLESYKLPSEIHNDFEDTRYLRPVFRDEEDLNTGILKDELYEKLFTSKYLIVICSPNSAHSSWVSREIQAFIDLGRISQIIPIIVGGRHLEGSYKDCLPEALHAYFESFPDNELLGVSIPELGMDKAFIRVVSKMLSVDFDTLWNRHRRSARRRTVLLSISSLTMLFLAYWLAIPVNLTITLLDEPHHLPPLQDGILTVNKNEYLFHHIDTTISVGSLPGFYRYRDLEYSVTADCRYENITGSYIRVIAGTSQNVSIQMHRNKEFAVYSGRVLDENCKGIPGVTITVEDMTSTTLEDGSYFIEFPLEKQTESKTLSASHPDYLPRTLEDVVPGENTFILQALVL